MLKTIGQLKKSLIINFHYFILLLFHVFQLRVNLFIIMNFYIPFTKSQLKFYKSTIWVISHIIIIPIRHNIFEGKPEQINIFCIICFTIYFNGSFKYFDMSIWVRIFNILQIVEWPMIRFAWW